MNEATQQLAFFGGTLFTLGMVGFLTRRSLILMFLSLELMLAGVSVNLIAFSKYHNNYQGQVMSIMVLTIAACEAAIALAMVVSLFRRKATLDVRWWSELNEQPSATMTETSDRMTETEMQFPKLTPAGLDPGKVIVPVELGDGGWIKNDDKRLAATEETQRA